jgi:hypothetical protein
MVAEGEQLDPFGPVGDYDVPRSGNPDGVADLDLGVGW